MRAPKLSIEKLRKDHNFIRDLAEDFYKSGNYEQSLETLEKLAHQAYEYNYLPDFCDDAMEGLVESIANKFPTVESFVPNEKRIVFYDSFAYDLRGYTQQYLYGLWDLGFEILFILSDNSSLSFSRNTLDEIRQNPQSELMIIDRSQTYEARYSAIAQRLKDFKPSKAFLHISPWEVLASLVFQKRSEISKYLIDFTDHAFWLGKSVVDRVIVFRDFGANMAVKYRKIDKGKIFKIRPYPIIYDKGQFGGLPATIAGKVLGFSGGSIYKIKDDANTFLNLVKTLLLRHDEFIFFFAQIGDDSFIREFIEKNDLKDRFILIGNRADVFEVFKNIDIYINTYPYGGGNMLMYAALAKKPILGLSDKNLKYTHLSNVFDSEENGFLIITDEEDFINKGNLLISNPESRAEYGAFLSTLVNNKSNFMKTLDLLLNGGLKPAKSDASFVVDLDYIVKRHLQFYESSNSSHYINLGDAGLLKLAKYNLESFAFVLLYKAQLKLKLLVRKFFS